MSTDAVRPAAAAGCATLDRQGLATLLGRSVTSVDRDLARGLLPAGLRLNRSRLWLRSEIEAWLLAGAPDARAWEQLKKSAKR